MDIKDINGDPRRFKIEGREISIYLYADDCKLCTDRNEELEPGIYAVETKGNQIFLCKAHAQEFLDGIEDLEGKGDIVRGFIDEADD